MKHSFHTVEKYASEQKIVSKVFMVLKRVFSKKIPFLLAVLPVGPPLSPLKEILLEWRL